MQIERRNRMNSLIYFPEMQLFLCKDNTFEKICINFAHKKKIKSEMSPILNFISHNRYWFVIIIGGLLVGVIDDNSFLTRAQYAIQIKELKEQIATYNSQYERDEQKLNEIRRNPKAITKIARENYMMKADDEDIFVLSDDETNDNKENETTE